MYFNHQLIQIQRHSTPTKIHTYHHCCRPLVMRSIHVIRPIWSIILKNCARFVVTKYPAIITVCWHVNRVRDFSSVRCKIKRYTHVLPNDSVISIKHSESDAHTADSKNAWKLAWNSKVSQDLCFFSFFCSSFGLIIIIIRLNFPTIILLHYMMLNWIGLFWDQYGELQNEHSR